MNDESYYCMECNLSTWDIDDIEPCDTCNDDFCENCINDHDCGENNGSNSKKRRTHP